MRDDTAAIVKSIGHDEDWHGLSPRTKTNILRDVAQTIFGTSKRAGIVDEVRALRRWLVAGGTVTVILQTISTFELQPPIKHAIVFIFGGH